MKHLAYNPKHVAVVVATVLALAAYFLAKPSAQYRRISSIVWTTEYHVTYKGTCDMTDSINAVLNAVDGALSMFNPASTVSRINRGDDNVAPNAMVNELLAMSQRISSETDGYYDPSVAPLVELWGFGKKGADTLPSQQQISEALALVGISKIRVDAHGKVVKPHQAMMIDFSSIAKGFAADAIGRMLRRNGIDDYLVEIGGEIAMHGKNPAGEQWNVSIDQPIESADSVVHQSAQVLSLTNMGVATSGNYRNYRWKDGKKIVHIINPKTGQPEVSHLLSATIVAPTAAEADAYATACIVMDTQRSIRLVERLQGIEAIFIYADSLGTMHKWSSRGLDKYLKNNK